MSGFEIVGVVLGALPLLIEGLKTYRNGLATASHMIKYEKAVEGLILRFSIDSSLYLHTCERLIRPLMLEIDDWSRLVDEPGGPAWRDEDLGRQIEDRLSTDYWPFVETTKRLHARLIKFATKLDLDPANGLKPRWMQADPSIQSSLRHRFFKKSNQTWKGLKVGFSSGNLEDALQQIETDLTRLDRLLDANERAVPARRERRRRANARIWHSVREAAHSVYNTLASQWSCPSYHHHAASLRLESRRSENMPLPHRFSLFLSLEDTSAGASCMSWRELDIEPQRTSDHVNQTNNSSPPQSSTVKFSITSVTDSLSTLALSQSQSHVALAAMAPSLVPNQGSFLAGPKIANLCVWQQTSPTATNECIGVLEYQAWHHHIYQSQMKRGSSVAISPVSLRDLLTQSVVPSRGLSTREKYHIATVVASSVLELAHTPWLPGSAYDLEDVFLMDLQQRALNMTDPYIRRDFHAATGTKTTSHRTTPLIENELIFACGVVLIELAYQRPLADFKQADDTDAQGNDYPHTHLQIATRLVKDLNSMEGEKYADAARKCIKCSFDVREFSLNDADFQEQFYTHVVVPLQELKQALG